MADNPIFEVELSIQKQLDMITNISAEMGLQQQKHELALAEYREQLKVLTEIRRENRHSGRDTTDRMTEQRRGLSRIEDDTARHDKDQKKRLTEHLKSLKSIFDTATKISKIALFGGAGIAGAAYYGMGRLADRTANDRFTAHNIAGSDMGGLRAANNIYGGSVITDTGALLTDIKTALTGINGWTDALRMQELTGKSIAELQGAKPADLIPTLIDATKRQAEEMRAKGQAPFIGDPSKMPHLPAFMAAQARMIDSLAKSELEQRKRQYFEQQGRLAPTDEEAKRLHDLSIQNENTATGIRTSFERVLSSVAPEFETLGKTIEDFSQELIESDTAKKAVKWIDDELKGFFKYIGSEEAKRDWRELSAQAKEAGSLLMDFGLGLRKWGISLGFVKENTNERLNREYMDAVDNDHGGKSLKAAYLDNAAKDPLVQAVKTGFDAAKEDTSGFFTLKGGDFLDDKKRIPRDLDKQLMLAAKRYGYGYNEIDQAFNQASEFSGVPKKLIMASAYTESRFNPNAKSGAGAGGMIQLMPATGAQYGVSGNDRFNPVKNIVGAGRFYKHLHEKFGNNTDLILAGYNAGENAVKSHGNQIPPYRETQDYVKIINKIIDAQGTEPDSKPTQVLNWIQEKWGASVEAHKQAYGFADAKPTPPTNINVNVSAPAGYNPSVEILKAR